MPWRNLPPDWIAAKLDEILLFLTMVSGVMLGMITKVAAEVRDGEREKILSSRLLLDVPALLMMASVTYGIIVYWQLPPAAAAAIGPLLGYLGPRTAYLVLNAVTDRIRGESK